MAVKNKAKYIALTAANITKKLKELGTYHAAILPTVQQLIDIDNILCEMKNSMSVQGALITIISREGDTRYITNPLIPEITKLETTKQRTLNDLLLTPASIKKNEVQIVKKEADVFDDAIKNRTEIQNEAVKNNKKRK